MKFIKGHFISQHILDKWSQNFVPDFDLFYFENKPDFLPSFKIDELDKSFFTLDIKTSFLTWSVDKKAHYISHVPNEQFLALPSDAKENTWREQKRLNRGLVFTEEEFLNLLKGVDQGEINQSLKLLQQVGNLVAIQGVNWRELSKKVRNTILLNYADDWIEEIALPKEEIKFLQKLPPVLFSYLNSFSEKNGPNCFAAVAAAITNSTSYILQWMQQDSFMKRLTENQYYQSENKIIEPADVLVWFNTDNLPVHTAYVLSNEIAFNKHGQTMFNPWQAIRSKELMNAWKDYEYKIYRKR
jgi:hypothetical protein